jgi:hypothetical protein
MNVDQEQLAQLLREAAEAHHEYEQTLGERDDTWAEWYAEYLLERLDEETQQPIDDTGDEQEELSEGEDDI